MPIYEYQCDECREPFEKLVRSTSIPQEIECPKCGSKKVHKTLSLFGLSFGSSRSAGHEASSASSCGST